MIALWRCYRALQLHQEMMQLGERGYTYLKFFPAEAAGGANYLKSIASPLPQFNICPTGGVSLSNAPDYLTLPNVLCVGGSWVAPGDLIEAEYWARINKLAKEAAQLSAMKLKEVRQMTRC